MKKKLTKFNKYQAYEFLKNSNFSILQTEKIKKIIEVLANNMFIDRNNLDYFASEKIGMSFLEKAINLGLVIETQNQNGDTKKEEYFFSLGANAIYICNQEGMKVNRLSVFISKIQKEKILNFNKFLMKNEIKEKFDVLDLEYNSFISYHNIYYSDISENQIINILSKKIEKIKDENETILEYFYKNYTLIKIQNSNIKIGGDTKRTYIF